MLYFIETLITNMCLCYFDACCSYNMAHCQRNIALLYKCMMTHMVGALQPHGSDHLFYVVSLLFLAPSFLPFTLLPRPRTMAPAANYRRPRCAHAKAAHSHEYRVGMRSLGEVSLAKRTALLSSTPTEVRPLLLDERLVPDVEFGPVDHRPSRTRTVPVWDRPRESTVFGAVGIATSFERNTSTVVICRAGTRHGMGSVSQDS